MSKFGCPERFVKIVRQFYDGMMACVLDDENTSDPFPVTDGVKQGCVRASTLFSLLFSAMLMDAFRDTSPASPSGTDVMGNCLTPGVYRQSTKSKIL